MARVILISECPNIFWAVEGWTPLSASVVAKVCLRLWKVTPSSARFALFVEHLAAEMLEAHSLPTPLLWVEHYPGHEGEIGGYSLVRFSSWELMEVCLGGVWRCRVGSPRWSPLRPEEVDVLTEMVGEAPDGGLTHEKPF
jgi:hypothetical protein